MYYNDEIDSDGVGLLGNKMFLIACCKAMNLKIGHKTFFLPHWRYEYVFPNLISSDLIRYDRDDTMYVEPFFSYKELPLNSNNTKLKGYFQSEKYFKEYRREILEMFEPNDDIKTTCRHFQTNDFFKNNRFTAIHVRRGDYLNLPDFHPTCTMEYYNTAMEILKDKTDYFIVFSDDIPWCKENIKGLNIIYSENRTNVEDLFIMSKCDNHIIANSSFSWWGSYLSQAKDKIAIAPKMWFGIKGPQDWQDIYREDMIVI